MNNFHVKKYYTDFLANDKSYTGNVTRSIIAGHFITFYTLIIVCSSYFVLEFSKLCVKY